MSKLVHLPPLVGVMAMGWMMGWASGEGKVKVAVAVFVLGAFFINTYYSILERRGHVFEDERTKRISEIAAVRTIQIVGVSLATAMITLTGKLSDPKFVGAFAAIGVTLAGMLFLHFILRHYYARVM
ncbi:hypothetical protein ADU37_CDS14600 [Thermococcus sp. 2319x1]|uniref:DUF2178 domain-containing protein n=1 Tax=Thermococcus sp. 2319x1 TaxID=1674923 RepID=UPI00073A90F9|nr:DUF2178 domain-containing protein [Thermococcus sp. 2319x1]ALV63159.1 hypothetical protein ADU37_CDS14600 [Thermococcus sp. 2319x1]